MGGHASICPLDSALWEGTTAEGQEQVLYSVQPRQGPCPQVQGQNWLEMSLVGIDEMSGGTPTTSLSSGLRYGDCNSRLASAAGLSLCPWTNCLSVDLSFLIHEMRVLNEAIGSMIFQPLKGNSFADICIDS